MTITSISLPAALRYIICFSFMLILGAGHTIADDNQIVDAIAQKQQEEMLQQSQILNEQITFTQVNSCQSMEESFQEFLELYKKHNPPRSYHYDREYSDSMWILQNVVMSAETSDSMWVLQNTVMSAESSYQSDSIGSSDYSSTNLQKIGVDEPEILKTNGEYIFYHVDSGYRQDSYIAILQTPKKSDLSDAQLVKKIRIPSTLQNIQLFLQDDYLIILWSRYTQTNRILGRDKTLAIIYNISDIQNLSLEKMVEVQGIYNDARILNGEIYLISNISLNRRNIAYTDEPVVFNDLLPNITNISLTSSTVSLEEGKMRRTYEKRTNELDCNSIFYLFPSEEALQSNSLLPNFTLISKISLENLEKKPEQKMAFGVVREFHMSENALYLPSPIYFSSPRSCRGCRRPSYSAGENTLIHKFNIDNDITYQDSIIVPGTPLSQYAMDQDAQGNFRILTKTRFPNLATQFFVFDKSFQIAGQLLNIEPGEEFKSSRYIGDKLYLVTFDLIDPLFVIDIADINQPKIIGELKIPGYSTYLHPYEPARNNVQYLIGLGWDVEESRRGGVQNRTMKIDLYKIDYSKNETAQTKCSSLPRGSNEYSSCVASVNPENIAVEVIHSYEFDGGTAYSPALSNPRMFVWNREKNLLLLPVIIEPTEESSPQITAELEDRFGDDLGQLTENDILRNEAKELIGNHFFMGIKGVKVQPVGIEEISSHNFAFSIPTNNTFNRYRGFNNARVGYLGDTHYFLLNDFAAFVQGEHTQILMENHNTTLEAEMRANIADAPARERDILRKNNLNQIGTAIASYLSDHGKLPATEIIPVQNLADLLLAEWVISSVPSDPQNTSIVSMGSYVTTGDFLYIPMLKNRVQNGGFVLLSTVETPENANWAIANDTNIGSGQGSLNNIDMQSVYLCISLTLADTLSVGNMNGNCTYTDSSELRYIYMY